MISNNHTNKVRPRQRTSLYQKLTHNIYIVKDLQCITLPNLLKQSNLVRLVSLIFLDFLALLMISVSLYYLAVGSCLLSDHCYTSFYGE